MLEFFKTRVTQQMHKALAFESISIAFQPIVDIRREAIWGFEALTRGTGGRTYPQMVDELSERRRRTFDKMATLKALQEAKKYNLAGPNSRITLNIRPAISEAGVNARFIRRAAEHYQIAPQHLLIELTEDTRLTCEEVRSIVELFRSHHLATGIDDFGSGYSGLNVLATCGAGVIKLDRQLIKDIDRDHSKQIIVESFFELCGKLGCNVVAEGVEQLEEARVLASIGIRLMQGYYFGRPTIGEPAPLHLSVDQSNRDVGRVHMMPMPRPVARIASMA